MKTASVEKPLVVAGGFSVAYNKIEDAIPKDITITGRNKEMIIYFLHTKTITLKNMNTLGKGDNNREYLDHHPFVARKHTCLI